GSIGRPDGQALALFAVGITVFCGFVGMSVDVGQIVLTRTDLQKTSDAAALAGAQDLPMTVEAENAALEYVQRNAGHDTTAEVKFGYTHVGNDTITVESTRKVNFTFLRLIGLEGTDVSADATVTVGHYVGGT